MVFLPQRAASRAGVRAGDRAAPSPPRARCCSAGATCRSTTRCSATASERASRSSARSSSAAAPTASMHDALERKLYVIRKQLEHAIQALKLMPEQGVLRAVDVGAHDRLQGHAARATRSASTTSTCTTRDGVGAGAGAPALLDQHLPDVGAGAPVPLSSRHNGEINTLRGNFNWMRGAAGVDRRRRCSATTSRSSGR